jgi:hypothetical protein
MNGGEEYHMYVISGKSQKEVDLWENQNVGGWIILRWIFES